MTSVPNYHNEALGRIEAARINRLLGLDRWRYVISIPISLAVAYLAGLAGAPDMLAIVAMLATQVIYGVILGIWEYRHAR